MKFGLAGSRARPSERRSPSSRSRWRRVGASTRGASSPGDLFFALRGPNHDGHEFVAEAFRKGAVAVVADQPLQAEGVVLRVPDTLAALQALAQWARRRWGGRVVAVTGSAGKTTTKEVIAQLLGTAMPVGKSIGNLNNHVGLPLSILRLPHEAPGGGAGDRDESRGRDPAAGRDRAAGRGSGHQCRPRARRVLRLDR